MEQWHCFKDKVKMVDVYLRMLYLNKTGNIGGIKCLKCGAAFVLEDAVVGRVVKAEQMIEKK